MNYTYTYYMWSRDLTVKRQLDNNPVLWELLLFISEGGRETSSLSVCAPVVRALLTVLSQHWQRCRVNKTTMFPKELASSISLTECLARVSPFYYPHREWIVEPHNLSSHTFCRLSGYPDPFATLVNSSLSSVHLKLTYCSLRHMYT